MSQPWFTQLPNGIKNSHREGQKTHEEMLNITNYYGNTIKTAMSYHLTPIRIAIIKKKNLQTINAGEGVEKRELSCILGGTVNCYSHYGGQYGDSLKC